MPSTHQIAVLAALFGALAGCRPRDAAHRPTPAADLIVSVAGGRVTAPDSIGPGWLRLRVEEDGAGHIIVLFRLRDGDTDPAALLQALDTARSTPILATALGGPEVGDTGEVVMQVTPGRYLIGCVKQGPDGRRHAGRGEAKLLVVTETPIATGRRAAPVATQQLQMTDFAYSGPERWSAAPQMLHVTNGGRQDHQLRIVRLRPGSSLRDWMNADDPDQHATAVAGLARLGPGAEAYLPVELPAGGYVIYCLIPDPASGRPHVELGMLKAIQIE